VAFACEPKKSRLHRLIFLEGPGLAQRRFLSLRSRRDWLKRGAREFARLPPALSEVEGCPREEGTLEKECDRGNRDTRRKGMAYGFRTATY
jgi:hypothetical protein